jgi:hypothetical protein
LYDARGSNPTKDKSKPTQATASSVNFMLGHRQLFFDITIHNQINKANSNTISTEFRIGKVRGLVVKYLMPDCMRTQRTDKTDRFNTTR